jgi:16S rRNA U1498 N3-methylase RsmE
MHRLFVPPEQLGKAQRVKLTSEQARHLGTVLRLKPGEEVEVFDGRGARFRAWLEDSPELDAAVLRLAERWRRVAQEAARQCGRADVPMIDEPAGWDRILALLRDEPGRRGLLLDPEESKLRLGAAARGARKLLLAVGPEGGFSSEERERARQGGLLPVGMGPLVLRTETAGLAALAVLLHVHGELG